MQHVPTRFVGEMASQSLGRCVIGVFWVEKTSVRNMACLVAEVAGVIVV